MVNELIAVITKCVQAEKIFCLGSAHLSKSANNIFDTVAIQSSQAISCQLLVLLNSNEPRPEEEALNMIETNCKRIVPLTAIVLPITIFNLWLKKGNRFAHQVYHSHSLVYDAGNIPLCPPGDYEIDDICKKNQAEYKRWMGTAGNFFQGALFYKDKGMMEHAAFSLHQAAELSLMSIVRITTGFRAGTHNVDRLFRYAVSFCSDSLNVLPNDTQN